MKRVLLLMFVSALLVTLAFTQTPDAASNTGPANVKGCLGGSEGNYTVAEDGTRQILKITTSSVDLKPHVGHDVNLIGHKASASVSSGIAENSFAVTELNMISEHCVPAAAAPVATVIPPSETVVVPVAASAAPSATVSTPAVDAAAPAATVNPSAATVSTPAVDTAAPAATVSPSPATVSTPAVDAAAPAATVNPSAATVSTPAVDAAAPAVTVSPSPAPASTPAASASHPTRPSAHPRRLSAAQAEIATVPAATVSPSQEVASPAAADTATASPAAADAATAGPSSETVSTPNAAATTPTATHTGSLSLLISFVVLVIVLGTLVPLLGRWRKRKMLERTGMPNLSFTNDASSTQDKAEPRKAA